VLALMAADAQKLLPIIVEMQQPLPPFLGAPNVDRALEALDAPVRSMALRSLRCLFSPPRGFRDAAGIAALSLVPRGVRPSRPDGGPEPQRRAAGGRPSGPWCQGLPARVEGHRVAQQGISGKA